MDAANGYFFGITVFGRTTKLTVMEITIEADGGIMHKYASGLLQYDHTILFYLNS